MKNEIKSILDKYVKANKGNDFEDLINQLANEVNEAIDKNRVDNETIVRTWTNGFAQTCYELEDGTVLAVNYNQDELQTIVGAKRVEA